MKFKVKSLFINEKELKQFTQVFELDILDEVFSFLKEHMKNGDEIVFHYFTPSGIDTQETYAYDQIMISTNRIKEHFDQVLSIHPKDTVFSPEIDIYKNNNGIYMYIEICLND